MERSGFIEVPPGMIGQETVMPEAANVSGRADRPGQATADGGAPGAPADDWLRAELDDEYPLPPMPAPRPRLAPQQPTPQQPTQQPTPPRFDAGAQSSNRPLEAQPSQPFAPAPVSSAPLAPAPSVPAPLAPAPLAPRPAAPAPVSATPAPAPSSAPAVAPPAEPAFGAPSWQSGQPAQHEPDTHVSQPLPEWVVVLADGVSLPIYGPVVIGRNPSQERFPDASVSAVADLTQTMSKTHARFWADGDRLYVDDLNSTNGVALFPGGNAHGALAVEPGVPAELRSGDVVQLGEYRLSIRRS